jgi:hypothetical protein
MEADFSDDIKGSSAVGLAGHLRCGLDSEMKLLTQ